MRGWMLTLRERERREEKGKEKERREGETNSGVLFFMVSQTGEWSHCLSLFPSLSISFSRFLSRSLFSSNLPCLPFAETTKSFWSSCCFLRVTFWSCEKKKKKESKTIFPQKTLHPTDMYPDLVSWIFWLHYVKCHEINREFFSRLPISYRIP